jgi:hypothetical protein
MSPQRLHDTPGAFSFIQSVRKRCRALNPAISGEPLFFCLPAAADPPMVIASAMKGAAVRPPLHMPNPICATP